MTLGKAISPIVFNCHQVTVEDFELRKVQRCPLSSTIQKGRVIDAISGSSTRGEKNRIRLNRRSIAKYHPLEKCKNVDKKLT